MQALLYGILMATAMFLASEVAARSVYINGVDASNTKNVKLENVTIQISPGGDIYIEAPQYSVNAVSSFKPLTKAHTSNGPGYSQGFSGNGNAPQHGVVEHLPSFEEFTNGDGDATLPVTGDNGKKAAAPNGQLQQGNVAAPELIPKQ